jgi:hypothetical protein
MTLKDKVKLYERVLRKLAVIDVEKECDEALNHLSNTYVENKYPFAFGMVGQSFKNAVLDVRWALLDAGENWVEREIK